MLLALTLLGYIFGGILLIAGVVWLTVNLRNEESPDGWDIFSAGIGLVLTVVGVVANFFGNQTYDKVTNIYSVKVSETFTLGASNGFYYFNTTNSTKGVRTDMVILVQIENSEQPYLLEHKEKWETREYFLYIPENTNIIQHSIK